MMRIVPVGAVGDLESFGADARLDGQFHGQRRLARRDDLGIATALNLTN